ncbi:MAG: sulfotransferase family protein [Thermogutta sp.]
MVKDGVQAKDVGGYRDRPWIPRFWDGITFFGWIKVMADHGFRIAPRRLGMAILISFIGLFNSFLALIQQLILGRRINKTQLPADPIFIIGHWRSGTTLLHEMFILDPRLGFPDSYACFAPNHFHISRLFLAPLLGLLMPKMRPIDNMRFDWSRPQEDEFALCNMGVPSPYLSLIFPNEKPRYDRYLTMEGLSERELNWWKQKVLWFLKSVTFGNPRRMVLKSPPHTCRIRVLLEMFPQAKFVHIYRDPYAVFPSTVNLWKRLSRDEALQVPYYRGLEERVFDVFCKMYEAFERDRPLIPPRQLAEVSYEALVADPEGEMERLYRELDLGDFEVLRPHLAQFIAERANYKRNRFELSPTLKAEISRRWRFFFEKYGYFIEPEGVSESKCSSDPAFPRKD